MSLKDLMAHPLTRGLDLDDPRTTRLRKQVIQEKKFLRKIYEEWYEMMVIALPPGNLGVLELGSGAGFFGGYCPGLLTTDVFLCPGIHAVCDGQDLPFANGSLRAILMTDVLHHIPQARRFFNEALRCLKPGGRVVMVEPWVTPWSHFVYDILHHEPFNPHAAQWEFPSTGPLSGANDALPWIILERDRAIYEQEFPGLKIVRVELCMPFRYLVCGGVSLRTIMPGWSFAFWRGLEHLLAPLMRFLAMFAFIVLERE